MSDGQPINVNITVDTTAANAAFSQMAQVLQQSMQQMNQSFTDLQQTMQKSIQQAFQPLSDAMTKQSRNGVLMAASVQPMLQALSGLKNKIQETIGASVNWTAEVNAMSNMMGISAKTAGGLTNALTRLGISTDTYKSAVFSLQRAIKGQEDALNAIEAE